ncbi:ABC transporter substrate-binding protein [Halomarina pelagica]|uniref:ABC transporter substrate-binding protein n=1 Tax=Halomarina pelagica TaxID=2961599 RepID=UPI0020C3B31E|nr:extracellular solute-binding protein [Halomarina sp. BND7]
MTRESTTPAVSRRTVLEGIGGAAAVTALAGCLDGIYGGGGGGTNDGSGSGNGNGSGSGGTSRITFWTTQVENDRKQVIRELIRSYESGHPTNVEMIAVKEDDLPTRIASARASGTLPAIAEFGLSPMQKLGSGGLLSKQAAADVIGAVGEDTFYQGALDLTRAPDGGHYAVPMHGWVEGFWYRKSVLEEHGLDGPTTWDDLLNAAKTLHRPDENQFGTVVGTKKTSFARQCFTPFARSNGARVFDEAGEIVFDSREMIEALKFYGKLAQYTPPGKDTWKTANHTYLNGQCHLIEYSTYIMGDVAGKGTEMVEDTGFSPYVERKRRSSFGQIVALNLFSSASKEALDAAKTYAEFLLTGKQYVKWLHMAPGGMNPVLKPTARSEAFKDNETLKAWGATVEDVSDAFENIERFGYVEGKAFPELGKITNEYLIAEAVSRVAGGEDAATVAREQAEEMRRVVGQ